MYAYEQENIDKIVNELYLRITKQGKYAEIEDISYFVDELP